MSDPIFVQGGQLTDAGKKVVDYIEAAIAKAEALVEGQDITPLNQMSGPMKDYWLNVQKAHILNPSEFVRDRRYAASKVWELVEAEEKARAAEAQTDTRANDLEARLKMVEDKLTEALAGIRARDEKITNLEAVPPSPVVETVEDDPKSGKKKTRKEPEGAETAPQGDEKEKET